MNKHEELHVRSAAFESHPWKQQGPVFKQLSFVAWTSSEHYAHGSTQCTQAQAPGEEEAALRTREHTLTGDGESISHTRPGDEWCQEFWEVTRQQKEHFHCLHNSKANKKAHFHLQNWEAKTICTLLNHTKETTLGHQHQKKPNTLVCNTTEVKLFPLTDLKG